MNGLAQLTMYRLLLGFASVFLIPLGVAVIYVAGRLLLESTGNVTTLQLSLMAVLIGSGICALHVGIVAIARLLKTWRKSPK